MTDAEEGPDEVETGWAKARRKIGRAIVGPPVQMPLGPQISKDGQSWLDGDTWRPRFDNSKCPYCFSEINPSATRCSSCAGALR